MRIGFTSADFDALAETWSAYFPERYAVSPELIRQNTVDCPVFDWGASGIDVFDDKALAFLSIKRSANPQLYRGPDYFQAHLNAIAYSDPERAIDLLAFAKKTLRNRGVEKLIFGQDSRHFFPGCPSDCRALEDFLTVAGFEPGGLMYDVDSDLRNYRPPVDVEQILRDNHAECGSGCDEDAAEVARFVKHEFSPRWAYDVASKIQADGACECVHILKVDGQIAGFSIVHSGEPKLCLGGSNWKRGLGANWGSLGPIGVAKALRGRGLGDALLASALLDLKQRGVRQCIIDWTGLTNWYGKHGFAITRTYRGFTLSLR